MSSESGAGSLLAPDSAPVEAEDRGWLSDVLRMLLGLVCGFLLLFLIRRGIERGPHFSVSESGVELVSLPPEVSDVARIRGPRPWLPCTASLLDPLLAPVLRSRFEESPWVAAVVKIERRFDGRVIVKLRYRVPVGVFVCEGERIAVDEEGLAIESATPLGPPDIPEIRLEGPEIHELPVDGARFWQEPVLEAAALLGELRRWSIHPALESLNIVAVCVGRGDPQRVPGSADLELLLDQGVRIRWGRSPLSPYAATEKPTQEKLDGLLRVLRSRAGLFGLESVDLFSRDPIMRPKG